MTVWNNEPNLDYYAKGDGPGKYFSLYCKNGAWGDQFKWDSSRKGWVPTTNLMDMLFKMELSLDQVSYEEAKAEFPEAFPINFLEGEKDG